MPPFLITVIVGLSKKEVNVAISKTPIDVVVANLNAKTLLKNHGALYTLRRMCGADTYLLLSTSIEGMRDELRGLMMRRGIKRIYGFGGDRTQASILDWLESMPEDMRPDFVPLPAGQMNLLARSCGFRGKPIKLLANILRQQMRLGHIWYRPLCVQDPETGAKRHSIIMADGVVYEFIRVYDRAGKGNAFVVSVWMVGIVAFWMLRKLARMAYRACATMIPRLPKLPRGDRHPLFRRYNGVVSLAAPSGTYMRSGVHYGFVLSTLHRVSAGMQPFRGGEGMSKDGFWSILYWGPILPVVRSLWGLMTGWGNLDAMSPWMFNRPVDRADVELFGRWVFDGDPEPCALVSPNPGTPINHVRVTLAPRVRLLVNDLA